jgi:hypothetical protein
MEELKKEAVVEEKTEDPGETPLFANGPTQNMVEGWKSQYKAIYLTEFDEDTIFIWRSLNRKEYKDIMKIENADQYYKEERICEKCVLWPKNYSFMTMGNGKAGVPSFIAEQIMDKSGFIAKTGALRL